MLNELIHGILGLCFLGAGIVLGLGALRFRGRAVVCRARVAEHVAYRSAKTGSSKLTYRPRVDIAYPDGTYGTGVISGLAFSAKLDPVGAELDVLVDPTNVSDVRRTSSMGLFAQPAAFAGIGAVLLLTAIF